MLGNLRKDLCCAGSGSLLVSSLVIWSLLEFLVLFLKDFSITVLVQPYERCVMLCVLGRENI